MSTLAAFLLPSLNVRMAEVRASSNEGGFDRVRALLLAPAKVMRPPS